MQKTPHKMIDQGALVRHTLAVGECNPQRVRELESLLMALPFFDALKLCRSQKSLKLSYDASRYKLDEMIHIVESCGIVVRKDGWLKYRLAWQRQVDQNASDNAHHQAHCCNKSVKR